MTTTITLKQIRKHSLCQDGWENLLEHLGKTKADDEPLKFSEILESNGLDDAIWCLRALPKEHDGKIRCLTADFAERVLHIFEEKYPDDKRPREAIQGARDYVEGKITLDELKVFRRAADDAADAAAYAADAYAYAAADAADAYAYAAYADADAYAYAAAAADAAAAYSAAATVDAAAYSAAAAAADAADTRKTEIKVQGELLIKYFG